MCPIPSGRIRSPNLFRIRAGPSPRTSAISRRCRLASTPLTPRELSAVIREQDGAQQSAEEVIWSLPNGLRGYQLLGAWSQRRVDAFVQIVRDPRLQRYAADEALNKMTGTGASEAIMDHRLNNGSSRIGCHIDGMNRANNDIRDWLDEGGKRLPKGEHGADAWLNDPATVEQVGSSTNRPPKCARRWKTIAACF